MAVGFTEYATLKLNEREALRSIKKVNTELRKLDRTGKSLARTFNRLELFNTAALRRSSRELGRIQVQMQSLRTQARRPITQRVNVVRTGNPAGVPAVTRPPVATPLTGRRAGGIINSLPGQIAISYATLMIASATIQGVRERGVEMGKRENLSVLATPQEMAALDRARKGVSLGTSYSGTQAGKLVAEMAPTAQFNAAITGALVKGTNPLYQQLLAVGKSSDQAVSEMSQVLKAGEMRDTFYNKQTGQFEKEAFNEFMQQQFVTAAVLGEDYSGAKIRQQTKMLKASKFGMGPEAWFTLSLMGEEAGTTASVGWNNLVKQMRQPTSKDRREAMTALGVFGPKGVKNAEMLVSNLPKWLDTVLIPAAAAAGINVQNDAELQQLLSDITGRISAADAGVALIRRREENRITVDRMMDSYRAGRTPNHADNPLVVWSDLGENLTSLFGTIGTSLTADFLGPIVRVSRGFNAMEEAIRTLTPETRKAGEAFALAGGAFLGFKSLKNITGLATAGPALNLAAANLNRAALALGASGGAGGIAGGAAAGAGAAGTAASMGKSAIRYVSRIAIGAWLGYETAQVARDPVQQFLPDWFKVWRDGTGISTPIPHTNANGSPRRNPLSVDPFVPPFETARAQAEALQQSEALKGAFTPVMELLKDAEPSFAESSRTMVDATRMQEAMWGESLEEERQIKSSHAQEMMEVMQAGADMMREAMQSARLQWPGGPRTGLRSGADIGYSGSGDGPGAAATSAIGQWS